MAFVILCGRTSPIFFWLALLCCLLGACTDVSPAEKKLMPAEIAAMTALEQAFLDQDIAPVDQYLWPHSRSQIRQAIRAQGRIQTVHSRLRPGSIRQPECHRPYICRTVRYDLVVAGDSTSVTYEVWMSNFTRSGKRDYFITFFSPKSDWDVPALIGGGFLVIIVSFFTMHGKKRSDWVKSGWPLKRAERQPRRYD